MMDAYKVSLDLSIIKLDKFKLHEHANLMLRESFSFCCRKEA